MSREMELAKAVREMLGPDIPWRRYCELRNVVDPMLAEILDATPQPASDVVEMRAAIKEHIPLWLEKTFLRYADIIQSCQDRLQKLRIVEVELNEQNTELRQKLHVTQAKLEAAERQVERKKKLSDGLVDFAIQLQVKIKALETKLEACERRYSDERAIVDRIWKILGVNTYEQASGKTIYEIIEERLSQLKPAKVEYAMKAIVIEMDTNTIHGFEGSGDVMGCINRDEIKGPTKIYLLGGGDFHQWHYHPAVEGDDGEKAADNAG